MSTDYTFPTEEVLANKLGVDRHIFHRQIKPQIILDHKDMLDKMGIRNPNIGIDDNDNIVLADPRDSTKIVETKMALSLYGDTDE